MTWSEGPFCKDCGRPTRYSVDGVYQCKDGCDPDAPTQAPADEATETMAESEFPEPEAPEPKAPEPEPEIPGPSEAPEPKSKPSTRRRRTSRTA